MKVRVSFTVDIDPDSWTLNYGIEGAKAIREDAKNFAELTVRSQFEASGIELLD